MDVLENSSQSETLIVRTAVLLSNHGFLAVLMAGLILAGILASTMSTSDSQLLAASSSISENLLQDCFGIKCTKKQSMLMARITVLVIAAISVFRTVLSSVSYPSHGQDLVPLSVLLCSLHCSGNVPTETVP